jgi:hypothetical protein
VSTAQNESVENNAKCYKTVEERNRHDFYEEVLEAALLVIRLDFGFRLLIITHELNKNPLLLRSHEKVIFHKILLFFVKCSDYHSNEKIEKQKAQDENEQYVQYDEHPSVVEYRLLFRAN